MYTEAKLKLTMDEYFVYGVRIVAKISGTPCNKKKMQLEQRSIFTIY